MKKLLLLITLMGSTSIAGISHIIEMKPITKSTATTKLVQRQKIHQEFEPNTYYGKAYSACGQGSYIIATSYEEWYEMAAASHDAWCG